MADEKDTHTKKLDTRQPEQSIPKTRITNAARVFRPQPEIQNTEIPPEINQPQNQPQTQPQIPICVPQTRQQTPSVATTQYFYNRMQDDLSRFDKKPPVEDDSEDEIEDDLADIKLNMLRSNIINNQISRLKKINMSDNTFPGLESSDNRNKEYFYAGSSWDRLFDGKKHTDELISRISPLIDKDFFIRTDNVLKMSDLIYQRYADGNPCPF